MPFLNDLVRRPLADQPGLIGEALLIGQGQLALEVAVYRSSAKPTSTALQAAWRGRRAGRAAPVLVVATFEGSAWIAGPDGEDLPIYAAIDIGTAERLCQAALEQPDRHAALLFLSQAMPSLETRSPGLRNQGLFALHELTEDVPRRPDWLEHTRRSQSILAARPQGRDLLQRLGYSVEPLDNMTQVLRGADRRLALAVLLDRGDTPEAGSERFGNLSPVSYALTKADSEGLDWVVMIQGDRLRLYPTKVDIGVGRRGRTETYVELQTSVLSSERIAYLTLLFSADALQPDGSVNALLEGSKRFAASLAERLRNRIYDNVMPSLAEGVVAARQLENPTAEDLDLTYQMALTILFRLLFVAYAEDRDLLPYQLSEAYRRRSLKQKAQELAQHTRDLVEPVPGNSHWDEVVRVWNAIERGDAELSVPAYNGGLFTRDPNVSRAGAALAQIRIPNAIFEPALQALLLSDVVGEGLQPVDFRSLGVREFGTIYEGLLESELSVADQDLMLDSRGSYVPVRRNTEPVVRAGAIYLHNRSGARKASGSYFTKSFAVEHLLERALVPALSEHLERVGAMREADAAEAFFDFRVADIAMGSGHFLIAAVDRIEKGFTDYLAREGARGAAGVRAELARLRDAARRQLGPIADQVQLEDGQLLRRLIARRCIYGVDQNPLSVQLARLAVWIHTFVPGLPLSVLDHNLIHGNSLVGVGTVAEIVEKFEAAGTALFPVDAQSLLRAADQPLRRLANLADATLTDVTAAREAMEEARLAVADTKALCDIITAQRLDPSIAYQFENWDRERATVQRSEARRQALTALEGIDVTHFPIAFPEVFLRRRSGFDVLLGNPPWKAPVVHELAFWARHFPGLRGLDSIEQRKRRDELSVARPDLASAFQNETGEAERLRQAITCGSFLGMGTGDPDLYKAFAWRFWNLAAADGGRLGVVLPRSAFAAKGSEVFRQTMFEGASTVDLTMLLNNRQWVFDEVHPQYTIGLAAIARGYRAGPSITLRGPFADLASFAQGHENAGVIFTAEQVSSWNDSASLPLLPQEDSLVVFAQLRSSPRLDHDDGTSWRARPYGEAHAGKVRDFLIESGSSTDGWPVWKGESFDLDTFETGEVYGYADPNVTGPWLNEPRVRRVRNSAFSEFPVDWARDSGTAPWLKPRVVFRDVARATDTRTVIASVAPPCVFLTDKAPYFLFPRGDAKDEAFLYGVLRSRPLDWYARRFVETGVKLYLMNSFPIPRPVRENPLWQRTVFIAGRLAAPDERFSDWADAVGIECGRLAADIKQEMIDELDAVVAHLYGLSEGQLTHIYETFHEGWDYAPRLEAVLVHFRRIAP